MRRVGDGLGGGHLLCLPPYSLSYTLLLNASSPTPPLSLTSSIFVQVHYLLLQYYVSLGAKLDRINRVLAFRQERWMTPYIHKNIEIRRHARTEVESSIGKLLNNA